MKEKQEGIHQPFVCMFCEASLPQPEDYDDNRRCGLCSALYGFELPEDGFDFACVAADSLGIPDGEPMSRINQMEIRERVFDILDEGTPAEDEIYVFFARLRPKD